MVSQFCSFGDDDDDDKIDDDCNDVDNEERKNQHQKFLVRNSLLNPPLN